MIRYLLRRWANRSLLEDLVAATARADDLERKLEASETRLATMTEIVAAYRGELESRAWDSAARRSESEQYAKIMRTLTTDAVVAAVRPRTD